MSNEKTTNILMFKTKNKKTEKEDLKSIAIRWKKYNSAAQLTEESGVDPLKEMNLFQNDLNAWMDSYIQAHPEFAVAARVVLIHTLFDLMTFTSDPEDINLELKEMSNYFETTLKKVLIHAKEGCHDIDKFMDQFSPEDRKKIERIANGN